MIRARLRMALPDDVWIRDVSTTFPEATLRLLTGVPMDGGSLELGEAVAAEPTRVVDAICAHPDVLTAERLHVDEERAIVKYETTEPGLFEFLGGLSLPPVFPLVVTDGAITFTVSATRAEFEALGDSLDEGDHRYDLLSVVHGGSRSDVLTERQRECLAVALRKGYFEVPRDCTLAAVAAELDVDKSTASETIRRGSARILDWFLVDAR